jgi:hypothetical protein
MLSEGSGEMMHNHFAGPFGPRQARKNSLRQMAVFRLFLGDVGIKDSA